MKIKSIILIISILGVSCDSVLYRNSITVETNSAVDKSQIKIEHGISATTINRNNDQYIFDNRNGYETIFKNERSKTIINEYGENDFLITYKDSLYFAFRQFKTNWHNNHTYSFRIYKELDIHFIEIDINGKNEMNFKSQMNPIKGAYKILGNNLRKHFYSSPTECFANIWNYENDPTKYITIDGKLFKKKSDGSILILTCDFEGHMYLRQIQTNIDLGTAKETGQFWIDKNNVYGIHETSDGELLCKINKADAKTFNNFDNSVYGKDQNYIFDTRHGIIKLADLKTFKPIFVNDENRSAYGRDKSNYFFWNDIIKDTIEFKSQIKIE